MLLCFLFSNYFLSSYYGHQLLIYIHIHNIEFYMVIENCVYSDVKKQGIIKLSFNNDQQ